MGPSASPSVATLPFPIRCVADPGLEHRSCREAHSLHSLLVVRLLHLPQSRRRGRVDQPQCQRGDAPDHPGSGTHPVRLLSLLHVPNHDAQPSGHLSVYRAVLDRDTPKESIASSERNFCSRCSAMLWLYDETWCVLVPCIHWGRSMVDDISLIKARATSSVCFRDRLPAARGARAVGASLPRVRVSRS